MRLHGGNAKGAVRGSMAFSYRICPDKELVDVEVVGQTGVIELVRGVRDLLDDADFDPEYDVFVDCSRARIARISFKLAEAMIAISAGNEGRRMAIVLPKGDGLEHAVRFIALRDDPGRVRGFATRAEASAWLLPLEPASAPAAGGHE